MLDIGWSELLVIAVVLIVVVGPKDLPPMIRAFGKTMSGLRKMAGEFRSQFDEALKEADMDDVRKTISDVQNLNPTNSLRNAMNPLRQLGNEIRSDLNKAGTVSSSPATSAPATAEPVSPLVSVPEPEMKLPEAPPIVTSEIAPAATAAPVAATPLVPKPPKTRAKAKSTAEVEAEAVAAKPKRAPRTVLPKTAPAIATPTLAATETLTDIAAKAPTKKRSTTTAAVADAIAATPAPAPKKIAVTKASKPDAAVKIIRTAKTTKKDEA